MGRPAGYSLYFAVAIHSRILIMASSQVMSYATAAIPAIN